MFIMDTSVKQLTQFKLTGEIQMTNKTATHLFNGGLVALFIVAGLAFVYTGNTKQEQPTVETVQIDGYTITITSN